MMEEDVESEVVVERFKEALEDEELDASEGEAEGEDRRYCQGRNRLNEQKERLTNKSRQWRGCSQGNKR